MGFFQRLFGRESSSQQDHYEQGLACEKRMDHEPALAAFTEAIRLDPRCANAYYARAFVREITGDYDQAIADYEKVIELACTVADELVIETDEDGKPARVVRLHKDVTFEEDVVACGPALDIVRVCNQRGVDAVETRDFDQAIDAFSEALRRSPFGDDADQAWQAAHPAGMYFERGRCYSFTGRLDEAVADLTKALEFNALAEVPEFRHHVNLLLGQCHLKLEDHDSAIGHLTRAIRDGPESVEAHADRADAYHGKGNLDRAVADNTEAIRLEPKCVRAYVSRSFVYADQKQFAKAIADASEAIRLAPENVATQINRASIYQQMGEHAKAALDYTAAIRVDPDGPLPYHERARAYRALGDKEKAARDECSVQAVTYLEQALAAMQAENWDQAVSLLNQAIELDPSLHRAYLRRGMTYLAKHEPDRTIADCDTIIDRLTKPTLKWGPVFGAYVDAFVNRGNAWMSKYEYQRAIADYTEAIGLEPKLAPVYEHRAAAYRAVGEKWKALSDARKAGELAAGDSDDV